MTAKKHRSAIITHSDLKADYSFKMVDEMRFTDEEVIRMNITLGVTGSMFNNKGIFFTDFLKESDGQNKKVQRDKMEQLRYSSEDDSEPEIGEEAIDPSKLIANSLKPQYLKRAIKRDQKVIEFNPDIDNFPGVTNIENLIICAMTDEDDN